MDDDAMRVMIRDDVTEVLDRLIADYWWIVDVDGRPITPGPRALGAMRMSWAIIGWQITGEQRYLDVVHRQAAPANRPIVRIESMALPIRYLQHFAFNFIHQNFFNLLRVSKPYCELNDFLRDIFNYQIHEHVDLSHNAFYTIIYMAQSGIEEGLTLVAKSGRRDAGGSHRLPRRAEHPVPRRPAPARADRSDFRFSPRPARAISVADPAFQLARKVSGARRLSGSSAV
ncbi:MAG: hypothetical protein M5R36_04200 [Deltaproteobacteria bacterium]|nr:hypothetical protein [Deltaproteobacteria bacterium]